MTELIIGGVPEHFNLPWLQAISKKKFDKKGIKLTFKVFHGGTGAMNTALRDGSIDMALVLTEGIIKDILNGNESRLIKTYVESPLLWGIHVGAQSTYQNIEDIKDKKIAISRFGSGSHLMAKVNAFKNNFTIKDEQFVLVKNLLGGVEALITGTADYFLWEHFTTKPYVTNGSFRRISNIKTPWPCFSIAARNQVIKSNKKELKRIIKIINKEIPFYNNALQNKELIQEFSTKYQQELEDIKEWLKITKWNTKKKISKKKINDIQEKLVQFGVIEEKVKASKLVVDLFE